MSLLYAENATTGKGGNMPGNTVVVNNALEWYVGDSKMDEVIGLLNKVGFAGNAPATRLNIFSAPNPTTAIFIKDISTADKVMHP